MNNLKDLTEPTIKLNSIEKWIPKDCAECLSCHKKSMCRDLGLKSTCEWNINLENKDFSKPGILIIDDNPGIVSFLEDDFEVLDDYGRININDYNIFSFTTKDAAYIFMSTIRRYGNINIQYAIIDITLGGTINTVDRIVKLTGIDVLEVLLEMNPDVKYIFYTGNQMNHFIKPIANIMAQYKELTNKEITDDILFKTELSMADRQEYILDEVLGIKL